MCRGRTSSWISTTSRWRRSLDLCDFRTSCKFLNWSRYSFCQRFQKSSESFSLNRNSLARSFLCFGFRSCWNGDETSSYLEVCRSERFRIPALRDRPSVHRGFNADQRSVELFLSEARLPEFLRRQRFVIPIILSHQPPHQAARGAINVHSTPFWARKSVHSSRYNALVVAHVNRAMYALCVSLPTLT